MIRPNKLNYESDLGEPDSRSCNKHVLSIPLFLTMLNSTNALADAKVPFDFETCRQISSDS